MSYFLGLSFILLGLFTLLARDLNWRLHAWGKRSEGVVNVERTPEWDTMQTLRGTVLVLLGCVALVVGCEVARSDELQRRAPGGVEFKSYQDMPPEMRRLLDESQPAAGPMDR